MCMCCLVSMSVVFQQVLHVCFQASYMNLFLEMKNEASYYTGSLTINPSHVISQMYKEERVSVCLFFIHFHFTAPILTKFDMILKDFPRE
jgi:hypothetical protein